MSLIYIVEDDKNISEIESFSLKNSGYDVLVYETADEFRHVCPVWYCLTLCFLMQVVWMLLPNSGRIP